MKKAVISLMSLMLCAILLFGMVPTAFAAETERYYTRLADLNELEATLLADSEKRAAEYPNGAIMLAETSADLEMNRTYAIDIFRQGGTKGEASIKLSTVDMSAGYGEAYRLYLSDSMADAAVKGDKKLYYYETGVPYIARLSEQQTYYMTRDNVDDLEQAKQDASEINDTSAENMPHSTETTLTFAEGETHKTVLIETLTPQQVTDDLEFMLVLSEPENCSISASTSGVYKITESREKPQAKLELASTAVNPEDGEAYLSVKRSGNLGGYDSFRLTTHSDTAKADEDYIAVAEDLRFIPNLSEIKVPVTILEGAEDGERFTAELSDLSDHVVAENTTATVTFDKSQELAATGVDNKKYVTKNTFKVSGDRNHEYLDFDNLTEGKMLGDWGDRYTDHSGAKYTVGIRHGLSWNYHAFDVHTADPIDFYGVKDIHMCYDHLTGSIDTDDASVIIAGSDPLDDGDTHCHWMTSRSNCEHWGMGNISSGHITRTLSLSDRSSQYVYFVVNKAGWPGSTYLRMHSYDGNSDCSFRLNLQDYDVSIVPPSPVKLYSKGQLKEVQPVTSVSFTDPNYDTANYTTRATFYRYDSTVIQGTIDSAYGSATLKGIYLLNPDDTSEKSSLITLNSGQLTLQPSFLRDYSNYIRSNKIIMQPYYEFDAAQFKVESYEDAATGVKFTADENRHEGVFTVNGTTYGTLKWSYDNSRGGKYYDGDEVRFSFTPGTIGVSNSIGLDCRHAKYESDLPTAVSHKIESGTNDNDVVISDRYFSVRPYIRNVQAKTTLLVVNPNEGDFTSKDTKYAKKNDDGSVTVTGFKTDNIDDSFENASAGRRLDFSAKAKDYDFACEWSYTDAVTHQKVTRYGDSFNYVVQNASFVSDNTITLKFIPAKTVNYDGIPHAKVHGKIMVPDSTILHPATAQTQIMQPAENAYLYMNGYVGQTDSNGQFVLKDADDREAKVPLPTWQRQNRDSAELHRALVQYNGNYYVIDVPLTVTSFSQGASPEITLDTGTALGVLPRGVSAYSADVGTYGDTITLVNTRSVRFAVDFDARNISDDKPVNTARWIFIGENGIERSNTETSVEKGASTAYYDAVISEKAKQGDKMYVEFYNKRYNSSSSEERTFYGRFEVGYSFVNANVEKVMSYMPDLGFYEEDPPVGTGSDLADTGSDLAATGARYSNIPKAPALGPVSPLFSIFGFVPTYSDAATGQKDQKTGKDLYCLEIGVQFSIARSQQIGKDPTWDVASISGQYEKLSKIISKSPGELAQSMQTSTKISITVTFAYQLEYYTADNGARHYTASIFLLGAKFGVRISVPFTIIAIPCFVYVDVSADNIGYLVHVPNDKTKGYWTDAMLDKSYYYETHGEFAQNFVVKFGVGIGFDGLASIGGHLDFSLESHISGTSHGKMVFGVKGGITAELLFFKVDKTWDIDKEVLLDTDAKLASVGANLLNESDEDLFKNTTLGDLQLNRASDVYDASVVADKRDLASTGADASAIYTNEVYEETNAAQTVPVIGKISDTRYMIAAALSDADTFNCLKTYIYDAEKDQVIEKLRPVDMLSDNANFREGDKKLLAKSENMVAGVDIVDCGDKLLLLWESCIVEDQNAAIPEYLNSFCVLGCLYDKKTGKFTDYSIIDDEVNRLPDKIKGVYNPATDTVHVFFESIDLGGITNETTLEELNDRPIRLSAAGAGLKDGKLDFTDVAEVATIGNTVTDYSVSTYGDQLLLSYISADKNGKTVEYSLTEKDYDNSQYGTKNAMYLNRYSVASDAAMTRESEVLIADEDYVTANPEFVTLSDQGVDNTLLFYKCNGRYGYKNINNLYLEHNYVGKDNALDPDSMTPDYITVDEDHTVGDDFKVYSGGDGELYALWSQSEGDQQQIWARQFEVDRIEEIDSVAKVDHNNQVIYESEGIPQTEKLSRPVRIMKGYWGNKVRLTVGGIKTGDIGTGFYKGNFDAISIGGNQLLSAYEAFDYDFGQEREGNAMKRINNRFVISEFDIKPYYGSGCEDEEDAVAFDEYYPNPGDTVQVTVKAANIGFRNGRDVTLNLKRTGSDEILDSVTYPVWLAGEDKEETFDYTVPEAVLDETVDLYYEIKDDGETVYRSEPDSFLHAPHLNIVLAHADPEAYFTDDNDKVCYHVTATVVNNGNDAYTGGDELDFIFNDLAVQADVMNPSVPDTEPFYINYGGVEIPEIAVGSSVKLSFVSDDIPEAIFDKYGTNSANLKLAVTPKDGIGWKEVKGEEKYNFLDELGIGQFVKPEPDEVTAIDCDAIEVPCGDSASLTPAVTPASAASTAVFSYRSSDDRIVSVSDDGTVKAMKEGTATVTISCGDVSTEVTVTVTTSSHNLLGDADLDDQVTVSDATVIQRYDVKMTDLSEIALRLGDVDRDGEVGIIDATFIQRWELGLKAPEGIGKPIV